MVGTLRKGQTGGSSDRNDRATKRPSLGPKLSDTFGEAIAVFAVGLSAIGQAISMAVLIFSGSLAAGLPRAIAAFCIAGGFHAIYVALRSRIIPAASVIQDGPAIVLVAVAAGVGTRGAETTIADIFVLLFVTTASTGILMWVLGRLRLGGLVRYMPTTVIGAFMAGTGWLLVKGGLDVMVGFEVGLGDLADLASQDVAKFWLPGVAVGVATWMIGRSDRLPVTAIGGTVVASLVGFYVVVAATSSLQVVEAQGWLIGPFPEGAGLSVVSPTELADADWRHILAELPGIVSVVAVSVIVVLLNMTGLSASSTERLDIDAELRTAGIANLVSSPLGSAPGFHGLGDTLLMRRIGARSRIVPAAAGAFLVVFGIVGVAAIGSVPRFIVGALLITVGASLLEDWIRDLVHSVGRVEQLISIGIVVVIGAIGILEGIGAGLLAACGVFIVRYSRVDPIRFGGTGPALRSRVDRTPNEVSSLGSRANLLAVFELQGYLFFGSLTMLDERFQTGDAAEDLDAVVFDFRTVTGIDTSGYALIGQLVEQLHNRGALVVISSIERALRASLTAAVPSINDHVSWAQTLDHALELTEDTQLELSGSSANNLETGPIKLSDELMDEFDELWFDAGQVVMAQGANSDGMLIVADGVLTAFRIDHKGVRHRLRRFGSNAMVGEIGLVTGGQRSAEVVAETEVTALWLSAEHYKALRGASPDLVFELHEFIMRGQAARVISLSEGLARSER